MPSSSIFRLRAPRPSSTGGLALLLLLCTAAGSVAQEESIHSPFRWVPRSLRVGLVAGYLNTDRGSLEFGPGPSAIVGGRFRARVSSPLSIELGVALGDSDRFVIDPRLETGPAAVDTVPSTWLVGQFGLQLSLTGARTWHRLQPYLLFGAGVMAGLDEPRSFIFADEELSDFRYQIGVAPLFQAGLGTEIRTSSRLGLSLEARDYLLRLKAPAGFFRPEVLDIIEENGGTAPEGSQWPNNLEFSITLWYSL